jgi:hypothetical protein
LAVFACVSVWVLAQDVWQVVVHRLVWTGTDGLFLVDQMQYLAWIQDAAKHVLVSDLFVIRGTPHDYFQPAIVVSGAITDVGVPPWVALLLWKPVAVLSTLLSVRAYCDRILPRQFDRRAALVLALFFGSFGVIGDEWLPFWAWGYPFGLLAIAALLGALLAYDRARAEHRLSWWPPVLGALASALHPWQGELLILIVIGTELVSWRRGERLIARIGLPGATVAATAIPLLYVGILYLADNTWRMAQAASRHHYSLWAIILPLLPLLITSIPAWFRRPRSFIEIATRVWLAASLAIYALSSTSISGTPLHAFVGITIPLAVLTVEGVQRLGFSRLPGWRLAGVALVAVATIPATVYELRIAHYYPQPSRHNANFIAPGERKALDYLRDDPDPGGVLTRGYLGVLVPARTGRSTYVGDCIWSEPGCSVRQSNVWNLFESGFSPAQARKFVRSTGARFLLRDCRAHAKLRETIKPLIIAAKHFGCATVYEVRTGNRV